MKGQKIEISKLWLNHNILLRTSRNIYLTKLDMFANFTRNLLINLSFSIWGENERN